MAEWSRPRWASLLWTLGAALAALALLVVLYSYGPAAATLERWAEQLQGLGFIGGAVFACVYAGACITLAPATPFPLTAGFLWGPFWGFLVAWSGEVLGALLGFGLGRTLLRERAEQLAERFPLLGAVQEAVEEGGLRLLLLVRLSPVFPFGVLNYSLGLSRVGWLPYTLSTVLGVMPASALLVYAGASLTRLADAIRGEAPLGTGEMVVSVLGLAATWVVVTMVGRATRRAVERRQAAEGVEAVDGPQGPSGRRGRAESHGLSEE